MGGRLVLNLRDWGDGTAELRAEVRSAGFSGAGVANFNRQDLRARARAFAKFPLLHGEVVEIAGGYWSQDDPGRLMQEHLYIGVTAANTSGHLLMRVRLAIPREDSSLRDPQASVSVQFKVDYQHLAKFAEDFLALVGTNTQAVILETTSEQAL